MVNVTENLGMIASPISEKPDEEELVRLLGELIYGEYGTIILDTPRDSLVNVTRAAVKVTAEAKSKLTAAVVMHPHEMALRAAEITAGELIELGIAEDARKLVINSFEADEVLKGNRPGITELGIVPYDPDITQAQNDGRLLGDLKNKNSAQAYRNIAGRIKGENIPLFTGFKMSQRERKKILMA